MKATAPMHGRRGVLAGLAALATLAGGSAAAQDWPSRPLHLVVPLAAGGNADAVARALAQGLSSRLGQAVVVENRPGAAGNIGMEHVARAAPDGHTLLYGVTAVAINASLYRLKFDPLVDLLPVVQLNRVYLALFARKDLPAATPREVLAHVRANPGRISCASTGGATQLGCALLQSTAGVPMLQAMYRGPVAALTDLSSGTVDLVVDTPNAARPFVESGRIRPVGTSAPQAQHSVVGELRSLSEALPGYVLPGWHGIFAPAGTPPHLVQRLNQEINDVLKSPEMQRMLQESGLEPIGGPAQVLADLLRDDSARYRRIAREAGIQPE